MTKTITNTEYMKNPTLSTTDMEPSDEELLEAEAAYEKAAEKLDRAERAVNGEPSLLMIDDFMRHALNHEILDAETERKLLIRIHEGIQAEERVNKQKKDAVSKEDEKLIQAGQDAMNELVSKNQRLVYAMIDMGCEGQSGSWRSQIMDYVQEGNIGLVIAAKKYDVTRGVKFATYATYWVRGKIKEAMSDNRFCIQIPSKVRDHMRIISSMLNTMDAQQVRDMTYEEICDRTGLSIEQVHRAMIGLYRSVKDSSALPMLRGTDYYAGFSIYDDQCGHKGRTDEDYEAMIDSINRAELRAVLKRAIKALPKDEQTVIELRFRLNEPEKGRNMGYKEIGEIMGLQMHQARDLAKRALWDLKRSSQMERICKAVDISTEEVLIRDARKFGELYTDYSVRCNNMKIDAASAVDIFRKRYNTGMDMRLTF